ncbi:endonuclease/exonuclease/phosphatase family protein [Streptomyces sp. NPDC002187]|uniref:endonuclease/exonuclease/phosphatase family protein n=1 Tax=Streptomyces sp. NPDC002187 TaxID=3364637 RepID=UPI0036A3A447
MDGTQEHAAAAPTGRRVTRRRPALWGTLCRGRCGRSRTAQRRRFSWRNGRVTAAAAVVVACLLALPSAVPNTPGRLGSLMETFLPWLGLVVPVLLAVAVLRRSRTALLALLLPAVAWLGQFGALLLPAQGAAHDLVVVQHNVSDTNTDPEATARALVRISPDLIALEEVTESARPRYREALAAHHPHHAVAGTVGLWSRFPLSDIRPLDIKPAGIGPGWNRALRATARTPQGEIAVYVAHLPSVRLGVNGLDSAWRDESALLLGAAIAAEPLDRVILLGDLNSTVDDRGLRPVSSQMNPTGPGFAFSWPAAFPVARIDQVMTRSATVTSLFSLPATGSDHLPVAARVRF